MDPISFVQPSTSAATPGQTSQQQQSLANNFDTFLTLLTSQIQNQDPLSPVESNEFTNQLVQFSQVEQQIRTNSQMEALLEISRASTGASLSGYLGQTAEIASDSAGYSGSDLTFAYRLPEGTASADVSVSDPSGRVIYSRSVSTSAGRSEFVWDGKTSDGDTAPHGAYRVTVSARSNHDELLAVPVSVVSKITGVDFSATSPAVTTAAGIYSYTDLSRITGS